MTDQFSWWVPKLSSRIEVKRLKAKDRLHKATTEALESKIDILEMDLKEELLIWVMTSMTGFILAYSKLSYSKQEDILSSFYGLAKLFINIKVEHFICKISVLL